MPPSEQPSRRFLNFVQQQAKSLVANHDEATTLSEWEQRRTRLRQQLIRSWGGFPSDPCSLEPRQVGVIEKDDYHIEKLLLQTRPDVWMTANAYVPERRSDPLPAVLCVHGHWRLAKSEGVVQSRCIGLAKLGFLVLMVDAFGAGERGIGKPLGEYHGEMVAGTLWPAGLALAGLQVYENMRAVDYLVSRPEVDANRLGVTGCSGGGNQTMYVGAMDDRLKCVVPVCSVGTYQAYLGAACCMCEVTPGALTYTEEADVLGLVAPRALMVINATRDAFQFSVGEAKKSVAGAKRIFERYDQGDQIRHTVVEAGHGYDQTMREAMYGWMAKHLQAKGDGSPLTEPEHEVESAEALRCFPNDTRPNDFLTLPRFAARAARSLLARRPRPTHQEQWEADEIWMRESLAPTLAIPSKAKSLRPALQTQDDGLHVLKFESEPGISIHAQLDGQLKGRGPLAVLLDFDTGAKVTASDLGQTLRKSSWNVCGVHLRATGEEAPERDKIGRAVDHNSAEWSLWIGRPLLGQWCWDVRRLLDALEAVAQQRSVTLIGRGPASLLALCVAAVDRRVTAVASIKGLATFVSDVPYQQQRLGTLAPGILRSVGDVPHIASLVSPRRLVVANPVNSVGEPLSEEQARDHYAWTTAAYKAQAMTNFELLSPDADDAAIVAALS